MVLRPPEGDARRRHPQRDGDVSTVIGNKENRGLNKVLKGLKIS